MTGNWQPLTDGSLNRVEPPLRGWIAESGLLTRRLRAACKGRFTLSVERQTERMLSAEEAGLLGCAVQAALAREIELRVNGRPCVFARTLIPDGTLRACPWLADLGASPLGETLRRRPNVARSGFEIVRLSPEDALFMDAARGTDAPALWSRRSAFRLDGAGLLVYEVFLPPILSLPHPGEVVGGVP